MKWYGFFNSSLTHVIRKHHNFKIRQKKTCIIKNYAINLNFYKTILYIPTNWNLLIIRNFQMLNYMYIYLYSYSYFFISPFSTKFLMIRYDVQTHSLILQFLFTNNFFKLFFNYFKNLLYSFTKIFFRKLKFKGKGYYIFKNYRNTIALQFGYSHMLYVYSFFVTVKFLSKTSVFMFGINKINLLNRSNALYKLRPINVFTGKGIRFSRQIVYRKTGKISSYR